MHAMIIPSETMLLTSATSNEAKVTIMTADDETATCSSFTESDDSTTSHTLKEVKGSILGPSTSDTGSESESVLSRASSSSSIDSLDESENVITKKRVSFDAVNIRSYQQTMGDNPAVSYGPPIQLDWDYEEHDSIDIDSYEACRGLSRRNLRQMATSYYQRKTFLEREYGFTEEETRQAKKDANKIKFRREVTKSLLPYMHVEHAIESVGRKVKRMVSKR